MESGVPPAWAGDERTKMQSSAKKVGPGGPTEIEGREDQGETHSRLMLVWNMKLDSEV